jgi:uncharacterized protein YkwD
MANRAHNSSARSKPKTIRKDEHHHYWPYLPMMVLSLAIFFVTLLQPVTQFGVLSYASEMSRNQLLDSTNSRRAERGVGTLTLNSTLNEAAQAKANDMISKDYWSHNTPTGDEPWIFFERAGYKYLKAGENLAYGFSTSDATVVGWMNSQTHRENMLDSVFTEVGFGFANGEDFNDNGKQTVVVAMYARPQVLSEKQKATPETKTAQQPDAEEASKPEEHEPVLAGPVNSDNDNSAAGRSIPVTRVAALTGGTDSWVIFATGLITGALTVAILIKHAAALRHLIRDSEKFVLRHPMFDTVALAIILAGTILLQTNGIIK